MIIITILIIFAVLVLAFYMIALKLFSDELYAKWENFFEKIAVPFGLDVICLWCYLLNAYRWVAVTLVIVFLLAIIYFQIKPLWLNFKTRYEYYS